MISQSELRSIIKACLDQDARAQRKIFDMTSEKINQTCKRYSSDPEEVRDLFQETYIKVFKHLDQYDVSKGELNAWVYRIAKNCILTHFKSKKIQYVELDQYELEEKGHIHEDLDLIHQEEILKEIQKMPDGYRIILNLFVFEHLSHHEIAEALQIQESTSRSQLVRARAYLKNKLETLYSTKYEKFII